jgi:hypothetical protein
MKELVKAILLAIRLNLSGKESERQLYRIGALPMCACAILLLFWVNMPFEAHASSSEGSKEESGLSEYWQEDGKKYNLACENGSKLEKISESELSLKNGSFLIESEGNITLTTPEATLHLKPRAMVLVRIQAGSERFCCMLENVTVDCRKRSMSLLYGEEVLLADHKVNGEELRGDYSVGVRRPTIIDLSDQWRLARMEFSLLQAVEREPLLVQISHSKHSHDKFLRDKLLKSAAILNMFTTGHGQYIGR